MIMGKLHSALITGLLALTPLQADAETDWPISGGDVRSTRHSTLGQITPENIGDLVPAWRFHLGYTHDISTVQGTPVFTGSHLVAASLDGDVIAFSPETGEEIWRTPLDAPVARRGLTFAALPEPRIYVPTSTGITALDANSGAVAARYESGVSMLAPIIDGDRLFVASLWEGLKAFDRHTGRKIWHTPLEKNGVVPRIWSGLSYDPELAMLYVVTSNPAGVVGTDRPGEDYSASLIALDAQSGAIRWHFQDVVHDLWDYDLAGNPLLTRLEIDGQSRPVVAGLSKTGATLLLHAETGQPVFADGYKEVPVEPSEIPGENSSPTQKLFSLPEPFSPTVVDMARDFDHLDARNRRYVDMKLRHARAGFFIPPSTNYDVIIYGLHGGANWPGGALAYENGNPQLMVPFNQDPWIIRVYHEDKLHGFAKKLAGHLLKLNQRLGDPLDLQSPEQEAAQPAVKIKGDDKSLKTLLPRWARGDETSELAQSIHDLNPLLPHVPAYDEQCAHCHGKHREGAFQTENQGDRVFPALVGMTLSKKAAHYGTAEQLRQTHAGFGAEFNLSESGYQAMLQQFSQYDRLLERLGLIGHKGFWQVLLDKDGYPATTPPWGGLARIDLSTGNKAWTVHHGRRYDQDGLPVSQGDKNFGGVITTASGLVFATGTVEPKAFAFSSSQGELLWEAELPFSGSAPPMTYQYGGCQYVVFVATGGQYVGYGPRGDAIQAYRLDSCTPAN